MSASTLRLVPIGRASVREAPTSEGERKSSTAACLLDTHCSPLAWHLLLGPTSGTKHSNPLHPPLHPSSSPPPARPPTSPVHLQQRQREEQLRHRHDAPAVQAHAHAQEREHGLRGGLMGGMGGRVSKLYFHSVQGVPGSIPHGKPTPAGLEVHEGLEVHIQPPRSPHHTHPPTHPPQAP